MKALRTILFTLGAILILAPAASAVVLWDQSDYDQVNPGFFNSESGSPPFGSTWFTVSDVTVAGNWMITDITTYYSAIDPFWGAGIFQGYVHVFPKAGTLPLATDDPTLSMLVPMTGTLVVDHFEVVASGLSIMLAPGDYWIGITPLAPSGPFGPEIHLPSGTLVGDASASYDKFGFPLPMWLNFTPGTDAAMLIEGDLAVPNESASWGSVKSLFQD